MNRINVALPDNWLYEVVIPLRITDMNYGHHMGNDSFLAVLHDARFRWLHQFGWTELDIEGTGLIMVDVGIRFKAEAGFGDELRVSLQISDVTDLGFDMTYLAVNQRTGQEVARARSGFVFFDYTSRKIAKMPAAFRGKLPG